jgi:hypothetical protein
MDEGAACSAAAWYLALLPLQPPLLLHGMVAADAASAAAGAAVQPHST